ncbi:MAG: Na+/H+ antiporter [Candidatus Eremiobacteraeota bacterium]|nr:Na+/H+ antiporter [Candidatus Eremiobacteraeota bacterium]
MNDALVLVTFLCAVVILSVTAKRFNVPFPISFVVGGIALAFARNLPHPHFDPQIVLLVVLPPLLYSAAWTTDWPELRRNWRPISLLAFGLVIFTTVVVAVAVRAFVPGFTWPLAFTLGAIVSPPDAVAAEAIFERISIPRRIAAIIMGECLVNDATALVLYRFALAAAISGMFSLTRASIAFVIVATGGVLIGIIAAAAVEGILRYLRKFGFDDPTIASVVFLLAPFAAYLPADALNVSGVLAAVTSGIILSWRSRLFVDSETRLIGSAVWRVLTYVLNALAFLLIGLQLPAILLELEPHVRDYVLYGAMVAFAVVVVRLVWVFPATYLPRLFNRRLRLHDPSPSWRAVSIIGWSGMRGIVSLAAALALPYTLGEQVFPQRGIIIFLTVCVVMTTLVLQGLTLRPLIEWLGMTEASKSQRREARLRIRALEAGIERLRDEERRRDGGGEIELAERLVGEYEQRINVLRGKVAIDEKQMIAESRKDLRLQQVALEAERRTIMQMRTAGEIPDDIFRSIEYDLDLAAVRLS